jgi:hypothetical protein
VLRGEGTACPRLLLLGGNYHQFPKVYQGFGGGLKAKGIKAIIIGQED